MADYGEKSIFQRPLYGNTKPYRSLAAIYFVVHVIEPATSSVAMALLMSLYWVLPYSCTTWWGKTKARVWHLLCRSDFCSPVCDTKPKASGVTLCIHCQLSSHFHDRFGCTLHDLASEPRTNRENAALAMSLSVCCVAILMAIYEFIEVTQRSKANSITWALLAGWSYLIRPREWARGQA